MKGVFGAAWFRDPALTRISPRLACLRTMVTDHGGRLFPLGPCGADGIRDATAKSPTRRRLYEEGAYTPMSYSGGLAAEGAARLGGCRTGA